MEDLKTVAVDFQKAYNEIKQSLEQKEDLKSVVKTLNSGTGTLVQKQKKRLEKARLVANQEKDLYVKVSRVFVL